MQDILARVVADLFDKSKGELSPKIDYLRNEIKKITESESSIFGKLRGLVESFQEIIPEEKQRYHAAIKALSTTSRLSREEIVAAVGRQLEELAILEKSLVPSIPDWRNELKVMEATAQEIRGETAKLRERITWLESEEKRVLANMAARQQEGELAEKAMWELFRDIGTEITAVKKKVEEAAAESVVSPPIAPVPQREPVKRDAPAEQKGGGEQNKTISEPVAPEALPGEQKGGGEQEKESSEPSAPQDSEFQKKCSMCGGRMDFYLNSEMWQCYSCAHEEPATDEVRDKGKENSEEENAPETAPDSESVSDSSPPLGVPWVPPSSKEYQEPKKGPAPSGNQLSTKKKPCPVCRKKMQWFPQEGAWRCAFCKYERRS